MTQIVTYVGRMGWESNIEEDEGAAIIPFIDALCRKEAVAAELNRIITRDSNPMMERVYEMLTKEEL